MHPTHFAWFFLSSLPSHRKKTSFSKFCKIIFQKMLPPSLEKFLWLTHLIKEENGHACLRSDTNLLLPSCLLSLSRIKLLALFQNIQSLSLPPDPNILHDWLYNPNVNFFFENFLTSKYDAPWFSITLQIYLYHKLIIYIFKVSHSH